MRTRAKVLTVATAMVTTFAILPTLGAAAAETLEDGTYDIEVAETTYTIEVTDGIPVIDTIEGVEFAFEFDDDTGRVLDEFDLTVDGLTYEVEIGDDGTVEVTADDDDDGMTDDDDVDDDVDDEESEADDLGEDELDDELDGQLEEDVDPAVAADTHGELVSTVAHCAPTGAEAREAGLPNHGFFVSAAARGDSIDITVDGTSLNADLSTLAGAEEFCSLVDDLVAADDGDEASTEDVVVTEEPVEETDEPDDEQGEEQDEEQDEETDEPEDSEAVEDDETITEDDETNEADEDQETAEQDEEDDGTDGAERSREARESSNGKG